MVNESRIWVKPIGMLEDYWTKELVRRNDSHNIHDIEIEFGLLNELNLLGYDFRWYGHFSGATFTKKDYAVVPIIIKYLDKFEEKNGIWCHYLSSLGVDGFYDATEFLIKEYKKFTPPSYDWNILNTISNTIARIKDIRFIDAYLKLVSREKVVAETAYIVEMLGKMKVEKAIPCFIELLNGETRINDQMYGTLLEDYKFLVSQYSIEALARFKNPDHIKYVKKFLEPEKISWITFTNTEEIIKSKVQNTTYRNYKRIASKAIKEMSLNNEMGT